MKRVLFLLFFLVSSSGPVFALDLSGLQPVGPYGVFSTFSTETVTRTKGAFEVGVEKSKEPSFYRFRLSGVYGLTDTMEFALTAPYIRNFDGGDGMEDIAVGIKHRVYEEGKYGPSFAYMLVAALNNGSDQFSTGGRYGAGLVLSKRVGPFLGHVNVFYERPGTGRLGSELSLRGGVVLAAAHSFDVLAEMIARKSVTTNHYDHIEARFGYRIKTTESLYTTLGVGVDLKKREPEYRLMLMVSFVPLPEKKPIRKIIEQE